MKTKIVLALFFLGLLVMAILELWLIGVFEKAAVLPTLNTGVMTVILGLTLIGAGISLTIWAVWVQIMEGKGTPAPIAATQNLVVNGPYAYTRNPMTLGAGAFYLGLAIWHGSLTAVILVLLIFAALLTFIFYHETKELTDRFGERYLAYKAKTPFLIAFSKIKRDGT